MSAKFHFPSRVCFQSRLPLVTSLLLLSAIMFFSGCRPEETVEQDDILDLRLLTALNQASNGVGIEHFIMPESDDLEAIPQDPLNPLTAEKVQLGKLLYHESALAIKPKYAISKNTYSCATCHFAAAGFQAGRLQGVGEGGWGCGEKGEGRIIRPGFVTDSLDVQPLRTPSAMNAAYQKNILWNGQFGATGVNKNTEYAWNASEALTTNFLGYEGLESQAIAGLKIHRMDVDTSFVFSNEYKAMFDAAYPQVEEGERYTRNIAGLAIGAYERTLLSNKAPFQRYLRGQKSALTSRQKEGAILFFGKAECWTCHNGPALANMEFYALGMNDLVGSGIYGSTPAHIAHLGRFGFTGVPADLYKFKVPQIYNLKDSPFYGHGSSFNSVRDVIVYKNLAQAENPKVSQDQLAAGFHPLNLTETEIDKITEFIEEGLYDPNLIRYQPTSLPSGMCFPMNDSLSRVDLGCF
ncbi:MAG: cytochrome-c peroxidase [Bacteroidia bacterium]|nr:cytochrome-c peroxidase [Bacteroidia bacterium]